MTRDIVPLIPIPAADDLGAAMLACTMGERAWVIAKIETGESNAECARLAGYSAASADALKSAGYTIAHRQRVQDALLEMSRKLMRTEGAKSIKTLVNLRDDTKVKGEVRLKAAVELLNRAGMAAVSESHLTVTHQLSEAQLDQKILSLAAELGIPREIATKMLIAPGDIDKNAAAIDADFEEVPPEPRPEQLAEQAERDRENARRRDLAAMSPEEREASKAAVREQRRADAKAAYAAAQAARQTDLEDFLGDATGLEDLLAPSNGDGT